MNRTCAARAVRCASLNRTGDEVGGGSAVPRRTLDRADAVVSPGPRSIGSRAVHLADQLARVLPTVVVEIALGILIGPHVLGWAISLAIAIGAGYALQSLGLDAEGLLVGVAVSTGVYCAGSRSGCCSPSQPSRSTPR